MWRCDDSLATATCALLMLMLLNVGVYNGILMMTEAFMIHSNYAHHQIDLSLPHLTTQCCIGGRSSSTLRLFAKTKNKKNNKKKKITAGAAGGVGGFGKSTVKINTFNPITNDNTNNFDVFPALDKSVEESLIPSDDTAKVYDANITPDIYGRLDQIYGFPSFNYPTTGEASDSDDNKASDASDSSSDGATAPAPASTASLEDLMTLSSSSDKGDYLSKTASSSSLKLDAGDLLSPSSSNNQSGDTDALDDILASVTGSVAGATQKQSSSTPPSTSASASSSSLESSISKLPEFDQFRILHVDPMVLAIDNFLTSEECDKYVEYSTKTQTKSSGGDGGGDNNLPPLLIKQSKTVGHDKNSKAQRTSTTWFHHYQTVPELLSKACRLLGLKSIEQFEEPQTVRYRQTQKFTWHLDALEPNQELQQMGGQRIATLLVYLTDIGKDNGGSTVFRDLTCTTTKSDTESTAVGDGDDNDDDGSSNSDSSSSSFLKMQPKKGSALLFFPSAGGLPDSPLDIRTLHAGEAMKENAPNDKWIAQMWIRRHPTYKPTGPPGNTHIDAYNAIQDYCNTF